MTSAAVNVVVKIGTSSLTSDTGRIDEATVDAVVGQICAARELGHRITLVTSGAIAAGLPVSGLAERPTDAVGLQALAAIGQSRLMSTYDAAFTRHGVVSGQVLLSPFDFFERRQYLHARSTLERLFEIGVVPVVNENDAVADDAIRFGDNDRIAALVAQLTSADVMVLLTDTDGLLTADPRLDPSASLIEEVTEISSDLERLAGAAGTVRGSGGMASKIAAAKMASWAGVRVVIAKADRPGVIADAISGASGVGTQVAARDKRLTAKKLWIAFAVPSRGTVTIDEGAVTALAEGGRSLLAVGVREVVGDFSAGSAVDVVDPSGVVVAKGLAACDATVVRERAGQRSDDVAGQGSALVVHRDDLVLLPG